MLDNYRQSLLVAGLIIVVLIFLIGATLINYRYVSTDQGDNAFLARWLGSRLFLLQGQSPYDEQTSREAQLLAYGRTAQPEEDPLYYLYPFYSFYLFAPFTFISRFNVARAIWMTVLETAAIFIVIFGISVSDWKIPRIYLIIVILSSLLWFYTVYPILDGNVAVLCVLLVVGAMLAIKSEQDVLAGLLLALSTIKPLMVILVILFILIWAVSNRRWMIVWSFLLSAVLLIASTVFLLPDWLMQNIRQIISYVEQTLLITPGFVLYDWLPGIGKQLGWLLTGVGVIILLLEWRAALGKGYRWFIWTANLTLVCTIIVGIPSSPVNFIMLLPSLILIFLTIIRWCGTIGRVLVILSIVSLLALFWGIYLHSGVKGFEIGISPVYYLVLPVITLLGLYWVRWWAVHKQRILLGETSDKYIE